MAKPDFQVLRSLLVLGGRYSADGKVFQPRIPMQWRQKVSVHGLVQNIDLR